VTDLASWTPRPRPERRAHEGRYVRIEPLDPARHGDALFEAGPTDEALLRYLPERPFPDRAAFQPWLDKAGASEDPLFFAALDKASGRAEGRLSLMRMDPAHGVIETGHLLFGRRLGRTSGATEAIYLLARHVFDELGYRRFEWKCNDANEPSKRAALRFGFTFEGVFRQHMVVKGENRDTAWYSMLDREWPARRRAFERWLDPANFDGSGRQRLSLSTLNAGRLDAGDPGVRLRLACLDDLAALGELQRAAYASNRAVLGVEPLPLLFDYDTLHAHYEAWVVDGEGAMTGALILDPRPDHLLIWSLATAPAAQRQGLGARLLAAAEARARQLGLDTLRLYTGEKLTSIVRWYHRHGYVIERVEELEDRRLVHMTKRIS
jgi:RimJ/RimL family protein N-acetyltransferase/ribosomal protein S18 acetylase RimI-like enzyme